MEAELASQKTGGRAARGTMPRQHRPAAGLLNDGPERRQLERDLRTALQQERLVLHYQPRLALANGAMSGAEALVRWPHRHRGLVSPAGFIPIAEQCGLITELGGWALSLACRDAMAWPTCAGQMPLAVSVNVSARQLGNAAVLQQVADALADSGLAPERLELELTESML